MVNPLVVLLGAGPGLGAALARRYTGAGYDVALLARDHDRLERLAGDVRPSGVQVHTAAVDLTDEQALRAAVTAVGERFGRVDVLHFNPSAFRHQDPLSLRPDELLADLRLGVAPLLVAVQAARPFLGAGSRVTATGSMAADRPWHEAASLGVQKAALRNLVRSVDATLRPYGARATSVTVNGTLREGTAFAPDRVAEALFAAAHQDPAGWRAELPYDGDVEDAGST